MKKQKNKKCKPLLLSFRFFLGLLLIFSPFTLALTKPIASTITSLEESVTVDLYVEVDLPPLGKKNCVASPAPASGSSGSFATNLGNLVLEGATTRCDGLWQAGDSIWYSFEYEGKRYTSKREEVALGTGLQRLQGLLIESEQNQDGSESSRGTATGGSGTGGTTVSGGPRPAVGVALASAFREDLGNLDQKVALDLSYELIDGQLSAIVTGTVAENMELPLTLYFLVFNYPNNKVIASQERTVTEFGSFTWTAWFNLDDLESGFYTIEALLYGKAIKGSTNSQKFLLKNDPSSGQTQEAIAKSLSAPSKTPSFVPFSVVFFSLSSLILFVLILLVSRRGKKRPLLTKR